MPIHNALFIGRIILITAVVGRQGKTAKGGKRETAATAIATNDRGNARHDAGRKVRPVSAAAAATTAAAKASRSGVSNGRLHLSNASSTLSVNSSSVGLARLRRSSSIARVAAEKKAKKALSMRIASHCLGDIEVSHGRNHNLEVGREHNQIPLPLIFPRPSIPWPRSSLSYIWVGVQKFLPGNIFETTYRCRSVLACFW